MEQYSQDTQQYIYTYSCKKDETSLCALEMRTFFGDNSKSESHIVESDVKIDPSRSPFIRERIDVIFQGDEIQEIAQQVKELPPLTSTYKVLFVKNPGLSKSEEVKFEQRREIEREIGIQVPGEPDLNNADILFAVIKVDGKWKFGLLHKSEAVWLHHMDKPHQYSTALSTRVARAVVNIAVPNPTGLKVIDPCCGIGTVLIEALSMGIEIEGSDINPLILPGTRENITYFGLQGTVIKRDIRDVTDHFDVAIIDLPYNLCSVITPKQQLEMLQSARAFTKRLVIVTVEHIDSIILESGFSIVDRCLVQKGNFIREVIVCE
ncbi:RsmD family RNA methyltransferase [Bacillus timonensis]|nr:RsmD family RNA methyltransferase [Bacillus timonensis]